MALRKRKEPEGFTRDVAGKGTLDDDVLPQQGRPVEQESAGGDIPDTAGEHGDMAPETAEGLREERERERERARGRPREE